MTIQELIDKLEHIKQTQHEGASLRIFFPDLNPLKKVRVVNLTRINKVVIMSDK